MSKTRRNALTKNFSGKFGDQMVYRNRDGVTTLGPMPKKNNNPPTESQLSTRRKSKMASRWAKQVLQDPAVLAEYVAMAKGLKTLRLDIHTDIREILRRMDDVYLKRKE